LGFHDAGFEGGDDLVARHEREDVGERRAGFAAFVVAGGAVSGEKRCGLLGGGYGDKEQGEDANLRNEANG